MKIYVVREHYYREGFKIVGVFSDETAAILDVELFKGLNEQFRTCSYDNPNRKVLIDRINSLGLNEYADSYDYKEYGVQ